MEDVEKCSSLPHCCAQPESPEAARELPGAELGCILVSAWVYYVSTRVYQVSARVYQVSAGVYLVSLRVYLAESWGVSEESGSYGRNCCRLFIMHFRRKLSTSGYSVDLNYSYENDLSYHQTLPLIKSIKSDINSGQSLEIKFSNLRQDQVRQYKNKI